MLCVLTVHRHTGIQASVVVRNKAKSVVQVPDMEFFTV